MTNFIPITLAVLAALCGLTVLICGGTAAWKWFIKGQNIKRSSPIITAVALALTLLTGIPAALMWTGSDAPAEATVNADNTGWSITPEDKTVNMSGYDSKANTWAYLRRGFGDKFDEAMTTITEDNFLATDAEGNSVDQAKIQANKEYLKAIGYGKQFPDGISNAVEYPSNVFTAEVYNNLSSMTPEELEELYEQHRWFDINWYTMTSLRFADMRLQRMERFADFNEQNDMWAPGLRETLNRAKEDPAFLATLYTTDADGNTHIIEDLQYQLGMLCRSEESAIITGIEAPTSIVHWELPSRMSADDAKRWTVMVDDPKLQESLPAVIWMYPNLKSGDNAYKLGYNVVDLRSEEFNPKEEPTIPTTDTTTNPVTAAITVHYQEYGTGKTLKKDAHPSFTVGKPFSVSPASIPGWKYYSSKGTTSGNSMPAGGLEVWFYYTANPDTVTTGPTSRTITAHFQELGTEEDIQSARQFPFTVGKPFKVTPDEISGWTYHSSKGTTSGDSMPDNNFDVYFYYTKNADTSLVSLTVEHRDADNPSASPLKTNTYKVTKGSTQTLSADYNGDHWIYLNNSEGNSRSRIDVTVTGDKTVVFYYYHEQLVTAKYVDYDTKQEIQSRSLTYWRQNTQFRVSALMNISGYEFYRSQLNNGSLSTATTVTGTTPANDSTTVIFYYKKVAETATITTIHKAVDSNHELGRSTETKNVGDPYTTSPSSFSGYHYAGYSTGSPTRGTTPKGGATVIYWYELDKQDGDGKKDPDAGPGNNGTGNATEGIGPGHGEEDPYIPSTIVDTPTQKGDEETANHLPTDNPGGQGAGSENRQEVGNNTVSGIIGDNETTPSSGNGGKDPGHVDTGATEVEGGGYTPPDKTTPAEASPSTSTTTTTTTTPNGDGTSTTTTTTTTTDISGTSHSGTLDWEP